MPSGTVKFYNDSKGYGFIKPDDGELDVFVHATGIASGTPPLFDGMRVNYVQGNDRKTGRPKAIDVRPE